MTTVRISRVIAEDERSLIVNALREKATNDRISSCVTRLGTKDGNVRVAEALERQANRAEALYGLIENAATVALSDDEVAP